MSSPRWWSRSSTSVSALMKPAIRDLYLSRMKLSTAMYDSLTVLKLIPFERFCTTFAMMVRFRRPFGGRGASCGTIPYAPGVMIAGLRYRSTKKPPTRESCCSSGRSGHLSPTRRFVCLQIHRIPYGTSSKCCSSDSSSFLTSSSMHGIRG